MSHEDEERAVLILSRDNTSAMYSDYSDFFEEKVVNGERGILLRKGKMRGLDCRLQGIFEASGIVVGAGQPKQGLGP